MSLLNKDLIFFGLSIRLNMMIIIRAENMSEPVSLYLVFFNIMFIVIDKCRLLFFYFFSLVTVVPIAYGDDVRTQCRLLFFSFFSIVCPHSV